MLSDRTIRSLLEREDGTLAIKAAEPLRDEQFQPASFDLRLGRVEDVDGQRRWVIWPKEFLLASTMERVTLGRQVVGRVEGKSSWARRGLMVHCAGFVDPGFTGQITLELVNLGPRVLQLEEGRRIAQICFDWVDTLPKRIYGDPELRSRYKGQSGPTPAREWSG